MTPPTDLLIDDDHRFLMESAVVLLGNWDEISLVISVADPRETLVRLASLPIDIALVNASMNATIAISLIHRIKAKMPKTKIVIYGLDDHSVNKFIEVGIDGYVLKEASFDDLLQAINDLDHTCLSDASPKAINDLVKITARRQRSEQAVIREGLLTPREKRILELIALGLVNKEIAQRLNISLFTVKNHVHNILEKFRVRYRREAIRCGYERGLLKYPWPDCASQQKAQSQSAG